jgi:hypothetical protein
VLVSSARVRQHHLVVVRVDDPGLRHGRLGHLAGVVRGRDAGADVEELPDAPLGHVPHRAAEERPVLAGDHAHDRQGGQHVIAYLAVGDVVVLAA